MNNFVTVPNNLYVHNSDIPALEAGEEKKAYINVSDPSNYTLIDCHAFQPSIQLNDNTFLVTFIMD